MMIKKANVGARVEVIGPDFYSELRGGETGTIESIFVTGEPRTTFGRWVYVRLDDGRHTHTGRANLRRIAK